MKKPTVLIFTCLTLLKEDIGELLALFQTHLQDVVFIIDGYHVFDIRQLEQYDPTYQAHSLLARGYYHETAEQEATAQAERRLIELKMSKASAVLRGWKEAEPEIVGQVRDFLLHRVKRFQQFVVLCATFLVLYVFPSLQAIPRISHLDFGAELLVVAGGGILLACVALLLFAAITRLFALDTRVFLFPGAARAARPYGRRETIGTIFVSLVVLVLISVIAALVAKAIWISPV